MQCHLPPKLTSKFNVSFYFLFISVQNRDNAKKAIQGTNALRTITCNNTKTSITCPACHIVFETLHKFNTHNRREHKISHHLQTEPYDPITIDGTVVEQCGCCQDWYPTNYIKHIEDNYRSRKPVTYKWMTISRSLWLEREKKVLKVCNYHISFTKDMQISYQLNKLQIALVY